MVMCMLLCNLFIVALNIFCFRGVINNFDVLYYIVFVVILSLISFIVLYDVFLIMFIGFFGIYLLVILLYCLFFGVDVRSSRVSFVVLFVFEFDFVFCCVVYV